MFRSDIVITLVAFKRYFNNFSLYIITRTLLDSILLSVSVFTYSCSSSGSSSFSSAPNYVVVVAAVKVSAVASWSPFVAVVLT